MEIDELKNLKPNTIVKINEKASIEFSGMPAVFLKSVLGLNGQAVAEVSLLGDGRVFHVSQIDSFSIQDLHLYEILDNLSNSNREIVFSNVMSWHTQIMMQFVLDVMKATRANLMNAEKNLIPLARKFGIELTKQGN